MVRRQHHGLLLWLVGGDSWGRSTGTHRTLGGAEDIQFCDIFYGKSSSLVGKSTISLWAIFYSYVTYVKLPEGTPLMMLMLQRVQLALPRQSRMWTSHESKSLDTWNGNKKQMWSCGEWHDQCLAYTPQFVDYWKISKNVQVFGNIIKYGSICHPCNTWLTIRNDQFACINH